jgi:hypothetical protein
VSQCRNAVGGQSQQAHLKFMEVRIGMQNISSVVTKILAPPMLVLKKGSLSVGSDYRILVL